MRPFLFLAFLNIPLLQGQQWPCRCRRADRSPVDVVGGPLVAVVQRQLVNFAGCACLGSSSHKLFLLRYKGGNKFHTDTVYQAPLPWKRGTEQCIAVKIGRIERRLGWPLCKDDTHKSRRVTFSIGACRTLLWHVGLFPLLLCGSCNYLQGTRRLRFQERLLGLCGHGA